MSQHSSYYGQHRTGGIGSISGRGIPLLFPLVFGLFGCAGQAPPPGGEKDVIPPVIERTVPDTNAVRIATDRIVLEFSEYVDRRSVEGSIFISPPLGELEYEWSGREVTILFRDSLKSGTTYVVSVGTDVIDLRERNRMAAGFTLAFSTGDSIDQGSVAGRVVDDRPEGVMIFAYRLDHLLPDTLDPGHTKPDFIMQTGEGGRFLLSHLPMDTYRLFAVRDEYRNFAYDREVDAIGMAPGDVRLSPGSSHVGGLGFRLTREDTTGPFVSGVTALTARQVEVRFSEPLDSLGWSVDQFVIADTVTGARLPLLRAYWKRAQPPSAVLILQGDLDPQGSYRVTVSGMHDRTGIPQTATGASAFFVGTEVRDTVPPLVSFEGLKDSTRGIPIDASVTIQFGEPVDRERAMRGVSLIDSLRRPVPYGAAWDGETRLKLTPAGPLRSLAWYRCALVLDSVVTFRVPRCTDSVLAVRFQTVDLKVTGEVKGKLIDPRAGKRYVMTAQRVDQSGIPPRFLSLPAPGPFHLTMLPEGRYAFSAFADADSSGTYSYGCPYPYKGSERFALSPDTVRVRARWGVEGVTIPFP
jgi:hypothetical protein